MSDKKRDYNQIAFALDILKLLSQRPIARRQLCDRLSVILQQNGQSPGDIKQKLSRAIAKLRDCGFEIDSAPNRPYTLIKSSFPVILSQQQQQALAIAAYFLADMGFSETASQIVRIGNLNYLTNIELPSHVAVDFNPPVDYSQNEAKDTVKTLCDRFEKQCRFSIRYCSSRGHCQNYDIDRSELRLHDGVLYLFAFVPDWKSRHIQKRPNAEQNIAFRVDRIQQVRASSDTPWSLFHFPTFEVRYRMSGPLRHYQPRRENESEIHRDSEGVEIVAKEDSVFWLRQRLLRYGANVRILEPDWFASDLLDEFYKGYKNYLHHLKFP
jgi:predicted DNA-binding transcriptional regulator YafY